MQRENYYTPSSHGGNENTDESVIQAMVHRMRMDKP